MEVLRLGVKLELQLRVYATATATAYPSHICGLHCSSRQSWILNPLSKARDRTCILMGPSCFGDWLSHNWNSPPRFLDCEDAQISGGWGGGGLMSCGNSKESVGDFLHLPEEIRVLKVPVTCFNAYFLQHCLALWLPSALPAL